MIDNWFRLEEGLIKIDEPLLNIIPEFAEIIKKDKGKYLNGKKVKGDSDGRFKLLARRKLTFIYFYCSYKSDFFDLPDELKYKKALKIAQLEDNELDVDTLEVSNAIEAYEGFIFNTSIRVYKGACATANNLADFLTTVDFEQRDEMGRPLHNPKQIMDIVNNIGDVIKNLKDLKIKVYKDTDDLIKKKVRAGIELGEFEKSGSFSRLLDQDKED
jgi:hypothetical protein